MTTPPNDTASALPRSREELLAFVLPIFEVDAKELAAFDANLLDLGLDSIRLLHLVEDLRDAGAALDLLDLAETPTLSHLSHRLGIRG